MHVHPSALPAKWSCNVCCKNMWLVLIVGNQINWLEIMGDDNCLVPAFCKVVMPMYSLCTGRTEDRWNIQRRAVWSRRQLELPNQECESNCQGSTPNHKTSFHSSCVNFFPVPDALLFQYNLALNVTCSVESCLGGFLCFQQMLWHLDPIWMFSKMVWTWRRACNGREYSEQVNNITAKAVTHREDVSCNWASHIISWYMNSTSASGKLHNNQPQWIANVVPVSATSLRVWQHSVGWQGVASGTCLHPWRPNKVSSDCVLQILGLAFIFGLRIL